MSSLTESLRNIQCGLKAPKGQFNDFGKYKYRSCEDILEALKPMLESEGITLTLTDELVFQGDRYYIKAIASVSDGEALIQSQAYARESDQKKGMDASQITGTASSYARKYALNGLFLIDDTKDDDTRPPSDGKKPTGVSEEARHELAEACKAYAKFTGSEFKEVMESVVIRSDFKKTDECYLRIANELFSESQ